MKNYISESDKEKINQINILDYLEDQGLELHKVGQSFRIKGWNGLNIDPNGKRYHDFSADSGGGIVKLVMDLEKKDWLETMHKLRDYANGRGISGYQSGWNDNIAKRREAPKEFKLPARGASHKRVFAYLVYTRKIDPELVKQALHDKTLYQNDKGSCVFVGRDENNKAKNALVRSTNSSGKSYVGIPFGANTEYPFAISGKEPKLFVFESPIDLLSYMTFQKIANVAEDAHYIAMFGLKQTAIESYIKRNPVSEIVLCVDNDEAGENFREKVKMADAFNEYRVTDARPSRKDWNNDLVYFCNEFKDELENQANPSNSQNIETER